MFLEEFFTGYFPLLQQEFWGNSLYAYAFAIALFFIISSALKIFQKVIIVRLKRLSEKTNTTLDDAIINGIQHIHWPFFTAASLYVSLQFLWLHPTLDRVVFAFLLVMVVYEIMRAISKLFDFFAERYISHKVDEENEAQTRSMMHIFKGIILVVLWIIVGLAILANWGINVTSLIASLGIGGIAIALALQNIFSDIFSSFSIYLDKPFKVGDFIVVGNNAGTVKHIGLKSTRIKLLQGEQLVIPNQELTATNIQNFQHLHRRRIVLQFGVIYETPQAKLEKIPAMVEKIINKIDQLSFDRCHLNQLSNSSLDYEVVYFVEDSDYTIYMDKHQEILFHLLSQFRKEKISFAYPTQVVYVQK